MNEGDTAGGVENGVDGKASSPLPKAPIAPSFNFRSHFMASEGVPNGQVASRL